MHLWNLRKTQIPPSFALVLNITGLLLHSLDKQVFYHQCTLSDFADRARYRLFSPIYEQTATPARVRLKNKILHQKLSRDSPWREKIIFKQLVFEEWNKNDLFRGQPPKSCERVQLENAYAADAGTGVEFHLTLSFVVTFSTAFCWWNWSAVWRWKQHLIYSNR